MAFSFHFCKRERKEKLESHKIFKMSSILVILSTLAFATYVAAQGSPFTAAEQQAIVSTHNAYRSKVNPAAKDMQKMVWDNEMADLAQQWANKCQWQHGNVPNNKGWIGQNLYASSPRNNIGTAAVDSWWSENVDYNYNSNTCKSGKVCGHYTQVVWAKSNKVGCGRSANACYRGMTMVVCNYYPGGNYQGQKPYQA